MNRIFEDCDSSVIDLIDGKNLKEEIEFYTDLCTYHIFQYIADMHVRLEFNKLLSSV